MSTLLVDIGGTGSRAALVDDVLESGSVAGAQIGPALAVGPQGIDLAEPLAVLTERLATPLAAAPPALVCVGMSGLLGLTPTEAAVTALQDAFPKAHLVLASDAVAAAAGALGPDGGVAVTAGTGVIGLATDFRSWWRRADGWGHLLGDEGGGAWVGLAGLRAALRAHDGRPGGSAALLAELVARHGDPVTLPGQVYTRQDRGAVLAGFAPAVARAAAAGDPIAEQIWRRAAHHLAATAASLATRPPRGGSSAPLSRMSPPVAFVGGLLQVGQLLTGPLQERLAELAPDSVVSFPTVGPLDGCLALARRWRVGQLASVPPYLSLISPRDRDLRPGKDRA